MMNEGTVLAFQSIVHAVGLMLIFAGAGLALYGLVKKETHYLQLGLAGGAISTLIYLLTA
jgi:hypothetical protein